jgi:opacity protein-like surface antigen
MRFIFAILGTALLVAAPAYSADDSAFYAGAGIGTLSLSSDNIPGTGGRSFDGSDFAFKILGGWQMNKYFAFEVEYFDGGSPEDKFNVPEVPGGKVPIKISLDGWTTSVIAMWPFGDQFNVFGKVGAVFWSGDLKARAKYEGEVVYRDSSSDSSTDFAWGLGGTWNFMDNMSVRAEYQQFEISDFNSVDLITASFIYKF